MHADDLVITAENEQDLQDRVIEWQDFLGRGGFKVNVDKTQLMVCNKQDRDIIAIHESRGSVAKQVENFKYLGSILSHEGGRELELENRIRAARGKWREVAGLICDQKMANELKLIIYS